MDTAFQPSITIIVPVYNVADHVAGCIDSLRAQTFVDFEALVIDDGSTDDSVARATEAMTGDPRFRLIQQENRGLSGARNTGLEAARGSFIAFLDSDDRFAPEFLDRMHTALVTDGGDWVACAIALCFPDGHVADHPAIHAAPPLQPGPSRRVPLDDCTEIARHFPSAWNKLYRRDFIGALRFRDGTWFEDHEFFWSLALRCKHMLYLPEPLYRHTRNREGQITGADDDRVFEQFAVLDHLAGLVRGSGRARADEGFSRLASRLVHERAQVVREPRRRARYLQEAHAFFDRQRIEFSAEWDKDISASLGIAIRGELPLTVALATAGTTPEALTGTLRALEAQWMPDFEVLADDPEALGAGSGALANGAPVHRTTGHATTEARGRYLVVLRPGDQPVPHCFWVWLNGMERLDARLGISGFERGSWSEGRYDRGFLMPDAFGDLAGISPSGGMVPLPPVRAMQIIPEPAIRIVRRDLFDRLGRDKTPLGPQIELLDLAHAAGAFAYFPFPALAIPFRPWQQASPFALALAISAARKRLTKADMPRGWEAVIFARALQAISEIEPERELNDRQIRFAAWLFRFRASPDMPADRKTLPELCSLLRLQPHPEG